MGSPAHEPALAQVRHWWERNGKDFLLPPPEGFTSPRTRWSCAQPEPISSRWTAGSSTPAPGLPKRINNALLYETIRTAPAPAPGRAPEMTWSWAALLGAGMLFGSILALGIALWGQLLLILHGCGLLGAGITISVVGITKVFVPEVLEFMRTTAETLTGAHARLVPLVAHDRATLGGMLLASGWVSLLPVLWAFRNGSAWLWWTLLIAGCSAYAAALGVHYGVSYMSLLHLLPVFGGLGLLLVGLGLSYSYLCGAEA